VQTADDVAAADELTTNELALRHLPLVRHVVQEFTHRLPRHEQRDDLEAAAAAGLLQAAKAWDPSRGVPFDKFAKVRIRGAVLDELRSSDWASRSVRPRARQLRDASNALAAQLGREPSLPEVAAKLGMSVEEVTSLKADVQRASFVYFNASPDDAVLTMADGRTRLDPEAVMLDREQRAYLRDAIAQLPERHRLVVIGYFLEERPMADLAELLGVTESRISQIRAEALTMLRDGMNSQLDPTAVSDAPSPRAAGKRAGYFASIAERRSYTARLSDRSVVVPPARAL
jgi:RNA polymerase sigma factor for flagellar operon FliA